MDMDPARFDKAYYERFYHRHETQAVSTAEQERLARFIAAYLSHLEIGIDSILDVGCGIGTILAALGKQYPDASQHGIELSPYLCDTYGWEQAEIQHFCSGSYDLVVCSDVLAYLRKSEAKAAIKNLAKMTTTVLYLAVLTEEDLAICDEERTDMEQHIRPVAWYRKQLAPYFISIGGGLHLRKPLAHPLWQLEQA